MTRFDLLGPIFRFRPAARSDPDRRRVSWPVMVSVLTACGARTGLDVPGAPDGGSADATSADASPPCSGIGYHDITHPECWSFVATTPVWPPVDGTAKSFGAGTFDGRYIYIVSDDATYDLVPDVHYDALVLRYDTHAPFAITGWTAFDPQTVLPGATGFQGSVFDGRYVYLVPSSNDAHPNTPPDGIVARYDTRADFAGASSWTAFDLATLNPGAVGYRGGVFDGRYVYLAPALSPGFTTGSLIVRYDSEGPFADTSSYQVFDALAVGAHSRGFCSAVFDGRYVYFTPDSVIYEVDDPSHVAYVTRYDTHAAFGDASAWSAFDMANVNPRALGSFGSAFDGRYVYFMPGMQATAPNVAMPVVRYDTTGTFSDVASWSAFDTTALGPNAFGFMGTGFDGRYVYLAPARTVEKQGGLIVRYDTSKDFGAAMSWSLEDIQALDSQASGFSRAVFDGQFMYFVPEFSGVVARFDTKAPPSMPKLPGWNGSFY